MSTENDPTAPVPRGAGAPGQPTAPVPAHDRPTEPVARADRARTDDPTLLFETFGERPAEPVAAATATHTLGTGEAAGTTGAMPSAGPPSGTASRSDAGQGALLDPVRDPASSRDQDPAERPSLRVGTVVWGLVIALVGAGLIAVAAGARFDLELALIALLGLAGVSLVAGSVAASMRRKR